MKKRIVSLALVLAMLMAMLPMGVLSADAASYSGTCGDDMTWELDTGTGVLTISGLGDMDNLNSDAEAWDYYRDYIKTVIITDGVTSIGSFAFYNCYNLISVEIPDSVTKIGKNAFYQCIRLTSIEIPENVTSIGTEAFLDCSSLTGIWVSSENEYYSSDASGVLFNKDKTTLVQAPGAYSGVYAIPEGVTKIGARAFYKCGKLTSITLPDSVTSIGNNAFYYSYSLHHVHCLGDMPILGNSAFSGCASDFKLCYVEGTKGWENCTYATEPWDYIATEHCSNVTYTCNDCGGSYTVKSDSPNHSCLNAVDNGDGTHSGTCSCGMAITEEHNFANGSCSCGVVGGSCGDNVNWSFNTSTGVLAIYGKGNMKDYVSANMREWNSYQKDIKTVIINDGVTSIGNYAFYNCNSLMSIELPDSLTSIGRYVLNNCNSLTSIVIPENVTNIEAYVFSYCDSLTGIWVSSENEYYSNDASGVLFNKDKTTLLQAPRKYSGAYVIPDSVTSIGNKAFNDCDKLTSVTIGDSVTSIGNDAFFGCKSLASVEISDSVTSIGDYAFFGCEGLTSIEIPDSVTSIGKSAFSDCYELTSVELPDSLTSIGNNMFSDCKNLTSIEIPDGVTRIGNDAFAYCGSLTSIAIPDSVTSIGSYAFYGCSLTSITIPDSVTNIYGCAFLGCRSLRHVHFLGDMPTIGSEAFDACSSDLKLCYMEGTEGWENCTYATEPWDYTATEHCPNVTYTCKGCRGSYTKKFDPPKHSCLSAVDNGDGTHSGTCSCGMATTEEHNFAKGNCSCGVVGGSCGDNVNWSFNTSTGVLAIYGKGDMKNYVDNNTEWESYRFDIKTVVITDGVTSIGDYAFYNCYSLMSVEIPVSVTSIGKYVFYCCYDLISVTIGDGVTSIGVGVFLGCDSLTGIWVSSENEYYASDDSGVLFNKDKTTLVQVPGAYSGDYVIPDSVTGIGDNAFKYCSSLTGITIPDGVTSIGDNAFDSCYKLTSVEIPDSVAGIGDSAFFYCNSLISVAIPDSVTIIGNYAFYNCKSLTSIEIPDSVTIIGNYAFYNCKSLTSVEIHDSVASIGVSVFSYCSSLISVAIPDSVTGIGNYAFHNCSSLTSITLPDSVTTIGERAFSRATSLRHIHFLGDMPTIGSNAFESCSSDLKLCYMEGTKGWENCTYATEPWDYTATEHCPNITYTCNDCGGSYTVKSDSPNHSCLNAVDNGDGTHSGTCFCGEAITEEHRFVNGSCICGAVEITQPILDASLTFGAQLYLENDLTMAFRVKTDKLAAYDISTAYLVVERDIYETGAAQATVETMTINEYKIENGRLIFSYPGIAAAQMNDAIRVTLYIKDAKGQEYVSPVLNTSVATYLDGLLTASASDAKLVTLVMDMVNYGAAAQVYFDRHADAPVNEAFESFKTYASYASADFKTALENLSATENAEGKSGKLNLSLDLGTRIGIQYKVTVPADVNVEDVTVVVTDSNGNVLETLPVAGNATDSRGRYLVNFYGSTSRDMRRVVYATAYAKGEAITGTYAYSISTYAWGVQENAGTQPADLVNVTRAMLLYGDSAAAYFS